MEKNDVVKNENDVVKNDVVKNDVVKNENDVVKNENDIEKKVTKDDMLIDIIIRQTDYSKEVAAEKLIEHKYNILSIVREYMSSSNKKVASEAEAQAEAQAQVKSTSQLIYGEIRNMMGNASANYRRKKEFEEYRQAQIQAHMQKQIQAQQEQAQQEQAQQEQAQQEQAQQEQKQ